MVKRLLPIFILLVGIALFTPIVSARLLPRYFTLKEVKNNQKISASQYISAKLREDRKALQVTFKNLQTLSSLDYTLTYFGSGAEQGVTGSIDVASAGSVSREFVFGTESKGVYTYHTDIRTMKFVVDITLKTGKKIHKTYIIKP